MQHDAERTFDLLAREINRARAKGRDIAIDFTLTDLKQTHRVTLRNGVLTHRRRDSALAEAGTAVALPLAGLVPLLTGSADMAAFSVTGDTTAMEHLLRAADCMNQLVVPTV